MSQEEKLALLNTIPVIESDASGKELNYALAEYNEENLAKLAQIVPSLGQYLKTGDIDNEKLVIDISMAAWDYAGATYFNGKIFT